MNLSNFGAYVITSGDHLVIAGKACRAGAKIIQYRDKTSSQSELLKIAKEISGMCKESSTIFIVNDNISVALISEADGVHLGQDDLSIPDARSIVPENFIIGKSTHSIEQAVAAEKDGADYIGIGPLFKTPTKESYIPIGIGTGREVLKRVKIPVVGIGGINFDNIGVLKKIGFKNLAMVREFRKDTFDKVKKTNKILQDM